jgi:hypothetical protein
MSKDVSQLKAELLAASHRCWRPWHWRLFGRRIVPTGDVLALLAIKYGDDDGEHSGGGAP